MPQIRVALVSLSVAFAAQGALAQDPAAADPSLELGVRYWMSRGKTSWNHNAQSVSPLLGNPTSVLIYKPLDAHVLELHGRKSFLGPWFVAGNAGLGWIKSGKLDDEDFNAGQLKSSDTTSSIGGQRLSYLTLDVGRDVWTSHEGRNVLGLFVGYQYWTERADANGASGATLSSIVNIPDNVPVISNDVTWNSLRVGFAARAALGERDRLLINFALVPYTRMKNEDSHYLRVAPGPESLGPTPNIIMKGRGYGIQLDGELRHQIYRDVELGAGIRVWALKADGDVRFDGHNALHLNELTSSRFGLTVSLTKRW
ncbi:MAG TPA: hypothetical protein VN929_17125 [Burkholderiales bacterium]|nr:hypothetical protein [Burkholderiales bacterium]